MTQKKKSERKANLSWKEQDYWRAVRLLVLKRDNHQCQKCGDIENLCVHHLTYEHQGQELDYLEDLETICASCHTKLHKTKLKFNPENTWLIMNHYGGVNGSLDRCIDILFERHSKINGLVTRKQVYNRCIVNGYFSCFGIVICYITEENELTLEGV